MADVPIKISALPNGADLATGDLVAAVRNIAGTLTTVHAAYTAGAGVDPWAAGTTYTADQVVVADDPVSGDPGLWIALAGHTAGGAFNAAEAANWQPAGSVPPAEQHVVVADDTARTALPLGTLNPGDWVEQTDTGQWWLYDGTALTNTTPPVVAVPPVFVADNGTAAVTQSGCIVFAGHTATLTLDAAVDSFWLAEWAAQTPWTSAADTPDVVQAGTTIDPTLEVTLASAGGGLTLMAKNATVWHAVSPGGAPAPQSTLEVHIGTTAPVDPAATPLWSDPTAPALFAWDQVASAWYQV